MNKRMLIQALLLNLFLLLTATKVYGQDIVVGGLENALVKYDDWLDNKHCSQINNYQHELAAPNTIKLLVVCKALWLGGIKENVSLSVMPNYTRSLQEAQKGIIAIPSDPIWLSEINRKDFYFLKPIFDKGEFRKGFFALPSKRKEIEDAIQRNKLKGISALQTLRNYSVITSSNWLFDLAELNKLGMPIITTARTEHMCNMVERGRADLYFGALFMNGKESLFLNCNNVTLEPIKGFKVVFTESRHFVISRKFSNSKNIFQAMQKGLDILRESGEIERAFYPFAKNKKIIDSWEDL